jgi:hypothetical protein
MAKPVANPWVAPATTSGQTGAPNGGDHADRAAVATEGARNPSSPERVSKRVVKEQTRSEPAAAVDAEDDGWQSVTSSHRRPPASAARGPGGAPRVRHAAPEKGTWRRGVQQTRGGGGGGGGGDTAHATSAPVSPVTSPPSSRPADPRTPPRVGAKSTPTVAGSNSSNPWHRSPEQHQAAIAASAAAAGERDSGVSSQASPNQTPSTPDRHRNGAPAASASADGAAAATAESAAAPPSPTRPTLPPPPAVNPWKAPVSNGAIALP